MVQHQQQRRRIEFVIGDRERFQFATPDLDRGRIPKPATGRLEHFAGSIDGDHPGDKRRQRTGDLPGAAPEIANRPSLVHERRKRLKMRGRAKQVRSQLVPLSGRAFEKLL
jgi:hypothetical protein